LKGEVFGVRRTLTFRLSVTLLQAVRAEAIAEAVADPVTGAGAGVSIEAVTARFVVEKILASVR